MVFRIDQNCICTYRKILVGGVKSVLKLKIRSETWLFLLFHHFAYTTFQIVVLAVLLIPSFVFKSCISFFDFSQMGFLKHSITRIKCYRKLGQEIIDLIYMTGSCVSKYFLDFGACSAGGRGITFCNLWHFSHLEDGVCS